MRCFVAVELNDGIKEKLTKAQELFRRLDGKITLVKPSQMHLTLKFLGEVPDSQITEIAGKMKSAAGKIKPFDCEIEGLGAFPKPESPKILWIGIKQNDSLAELFHSIEDELVKIGFPSEQRDFKPHLTIARIRGRINRFLCRQIITENINFSAGVQPVDNFILVSSELRPSGAVYTQLATIPLAK